MSKASAETRRRRKGGENCQDNQSTCVQGRRRRRKSRTLALVSPWWNRRGARGLWGRNGERGDGLDQSGGERGLSLVFILVDHHGVILFLITNTLARVRVLGLLISVECHFLLDLCDNSPGIIDRLPRHANETAGNCEGGKGKAKKEVEDSYGG